MRKNMLMLGLVIVVLLGGLTWFLPLGNSQAPHITTRITDTTDKNNSGQSQHDESWDDEEEDEKGSKIRLIEQGEFHGEQVAAKSGETWLGLFKSDDRYYLRKTKLTISMVNDPVYDGEETLTGKSVVTDNTDSAIFLLNNAETLFEGNVPTIFYADEPLDSTDLKIGAVKKFEFNGLSYELSVVSKTSESEYLDNGSKLLLQRGNSVQVLRHLKDGCNDCYWNLYWVGDLDRDGKLDFYFDLSHHYNVSDKRLYLSSHAEKGKFVKYVAQFWTNGC
jgi:hypothetical protein